MSEITDMFREECADRKRTARGAFNKKTHNGKGGRVKFPSDYLSEKEKRKMNGEIKTFKMNQPISWDEFKTYPDDIKRQYIRSLRIRFQVPDKLIAEMMGVPKSTFGLWMQNLNITVGKGHKPNFTDAMKTAWDNWRLRITHVKDDGKIADVLCEDLDKECTEVKIKLNNDRDANEDIEAIVEKVDDVGMHSVLRGHDINWDEVARASRDSAVYERIHMLEQENAILKAKLEMVYLIFGGEKNDD